ncbi:MAG: VWA domain-containing protein [Candidatus Hodarchaeota archaeon]
MPEIKIFVDIKDETKNKAIISPSNAKKLGISTRSSVEIINPENGRSTIALAEISNSALDFAGMISKNIIDEIEFTGIEVIIRPSTAAPPISQEAEPTVPSKSALTSQPSLQPPEPSVAPQFTPVPQPPPSSQLAPTPPPIKPTQPIQAPLPAHPPPPKQIPPPTQFTPTPQFKPPPQIRAPPSSMPPPPSTLQPMPTQETIAPVAPVEPYPNRIDINMLKNQKKGIIQTPVIDNNIEGGRVQLSLNVLQQLGLGQGMLIAWEDPLTRSMGSARIDQAQISDTEIRMSKDTLEDTNIQAEQIVIYSTEPPIQKASEIILEVQSQPNLNGFCQVSPRTQHTISIQNNDVLAFEDELTGAIGAGKVVVVETVPDNIIIIDSEILEASGIGSFEVKISKNQRQIIPLQSVSLGVSPISGENMWEIISNARQSVEALKDWLSNYIIFKGIKLRWNAVNIACSIIDCVPDLTGDILAQITKNTTLTLSPLGLIPFNAILIIDISRSMMARDVLVTNIAPAIEGIKAAMESREIQEFLKKFKDGINIPRRISAAFAAVLFLSEKVGRGFGEKVAVIRFADEAQVLPFGGGFYMDSASGKKGILEEAAKMIVDRIASSYGQATNMGHAMEQAQLILNEFEKISPDQPTMIVLLTDGEPTDGNAFFEAAKRFSENLNVVIYIVGLGNPNDALMTRAATLCGGEYFKPENAGDLLVWYSKRARDLTVKLKAHKT